MKEDKDSKKPFSIRQIGLSKIITLAAAGVFLLVLSIPGVFDKSSGSNVNQQIANKTGTRSVTSSYDDSTAAFTENMERRLENALRKVKGIGDVQVMITVKSSREQIALKDASNQQNSSQEADAQGGSRSESSVSKSEETVMSQSGSGESSPYVVKELEPEVEGVLVIARGGDDVTIISEINSAVQVLFHVPAHKIKVMKMI